MIFVGEFILTESIHYTGNDTSYPRVSHLLREQCLITFRGMMRCTKHENEGCFLLLTLANTKKLNAIRPNPTAVNVNESTSPIKFTFTSLSLLSRFAIRSGGSGNSCDDLFRGATSAPFIPSVKTFLAAVG